MQRDKSAPHILIVDDEPANRHVCRLFLEQEGMLCAEAANGREAMEILRRERFDLVLVDVDMPVMMGTELLVQLRAEPPYPHLKSIVFSGRVTADDMAPLLAASADDFLTKPFSGIQLLSRVKAVLRLKAAQEHSDLLLGHLLTVNQELEQTLEARDSDLLHARNALVLALAELVANRDTETGAHLLRLQHYVRCLADEAARLPGFAAQIVPQFINLAECCAPLHDIGKVAVPDRILLKPGPLNEEERRIMETHTTVGAETLRKVLQRHGFARAFLQMAIEIARHHHERWDGAGYPDRLQGEDIPLAARLLAIGDVYDALRSRRVYKPGLPHDAALATMQEIATGHFDPALFQVFLRCAGRFEACYRELAE
jgi:response regulator RpfG family c-di-GMP phosphodiesterase